MANERIVKISIIGDASGAQKALKAVGDSSTQAEVKVEGFGKAFLKAGVALGVGAAAVGAVIGAMKAGIGAVGDFTLSVDQSTKRIEALTQSQQKVAEATGLARREQDAGRATYQATLEAIAALTPLTRKYGLNLEEVLHVTELLAASDPAQGFEGAKIAIQEALSGDFTSLARRFELPKNAIQELKDQGVPNLQIVQKVLADLGFDQQYLDKTSRSTAKQIEILKGRTAEFFAVASQPVVEKLTAAIDALNKSAGGGNGPSFAQSLAQEIRVILDGKLFDQLAVDAAKSLFLVGDAFNNLLKAISGDRLNIDGPLKAFFQNINETQAKVTGAVKQNVAQPAADQLSGKAPDSPLAPAKVQGYGAAIVAEYVKGLSSAQVGDFDQFVGKLGDLFANGFKDASGKANTEQLAAAQSTLAQALKEVAQDGQVSETTLFRLATIFGRNVDEVQALVVAYARMGAAQQQATATTNGLATAQQNLAGIQAQARNAAADADRAIAAQQAAATKHAQTATDAIEAQQDALKGVADAAGAAARRNQAAIDALQGDLERAQAAQTAATDQRRRDSEIAQAAIDGTTEAYERQNDTLTEQDRKLAQHYETIIGGERRAKDAANERLNSLNVAANKEDLSFLTRIQAARQAGNAKEANALQRQFDARKKQRGAEQEIARAQAAVAGDEYDAKAKQIQKEKDGRDEVDAKNEKAAAARVAAIQADIKGVQDAAKAEADRYAAQQRGIQAEIDRLQDAAKVQARKDADALTALQQQKTETAARWAIEETGAKTALGLAGLIATANERIAQAAKDTLAADQARVPFAQAAAQAAKDEADARARFNSAPGGVGPGGGRDERITPDQISGAPLAGPPSQPGGPPQLPPLLEGKPGYAPPAGYHTELDNGGQFWWVPDGHTLGEYGKQRADAGQQTASQPGGADSLASAGRSSLLVDGGAPATAGAGGGDIHLHINAPNLTDIGSPAQQRALAAQSGVALRYWKDRERGGPPQGVA